MSSRPKLVQQILEVRFERGYRYLDRCGETMLILEELLGEQTGAVWMTGETKPTGARLICPDLNVVIAFDAGRFIVDQNPAGTDFALASLAEEAYRIIEMEGGIMGPMVADASVIDTANRLV